MAEIKISFWDSFIALIERFLSRKINFKEDKLFFEDENNLYNEKGELTPEYENKIKEYENYLTTNTMNDFLKNEYKENEIDNAVLEGVSKFTDRRHELFTEYDFLQKTKGELFNPQEFAEEKATINIQSIEEKENAKNVISELIEKDIEEMLNDPDTKEEIKGTFQTAMEGGEKR